MSNKGRDLTKRPLQPRQLLELEKKAAIIQGDTQKTYLLIRYHGLHPRVLFPYDYSDEIKVKEYNLHTTRDNTGRMVLGWNRPKKRGAKAYTTVPLHPMITFDVDAFIKDIRGRRSKYKRSTFYANRLMRELGESVGIVGLSPLSLRHTIAVELIKGGMSTNDVCDTLNIAPSTLRTYGRFLPEDRHAAYERAMGISRGD